MGDKMKAAFLLGKRSMEIREIDKPTPGDDEVLIKMKHLGVCGADVHFYKEGALGGWVVDSPSIIGHEPSGEIAGFGKNVKGFEIGDNVCVEPGEPCYTCDYCKKGNYNLCPDVVFKGVPGVDGGMREYMSASANQTYKLPQGVDTMQGCLVEPLAVGFHAVEQSGASNGMSAVILGSGCIGLMIMQALKVKGISTIYMVDFNELRLKKAKELGATQVINAGEGDAVKRIVELTDGLGADLVFEAAGSKDATLQTVGMAKRGGTITLVGMSSFESMPFDINGLIFGELTVKTVFRYKNLYPVVLDAIAAGLVDIKSIASHVYKFEDVEEALINNADNAEEVIKEVIEF